MLDPVGSLLTSDLNNSKVCFSAFFDRLVLRRCEDVGNNDVIGSCPSDPRQQRLTRTPHSLKNEFLAKPDSAEWTYLGTTAKSSVIVRITEPFSLLYSMLGRGCDSHEFCSLVP